MPLKRRDIESSLKRKGFRRTEGNHSFFIYHSSAGKKSTVRTKTSHGSNSREISDELVSKMAQQCKLPNKDFKELIACPLSRDDYEKKLIEQQLVDPPRKNQSN